MELSQTVASYSHARPHAESSQCQVPTVIHHFLRSGYSVLILTVMEFRLSLFNFFIEIDHVGQGPPVFCHLGQVYNVGTVSRDT